MPPLLASLLILAGCGGPPRLDPVPVENRAEPAVPVPTRAASVPLRYQGRWDISQAGCIGPAGEMRLEVGRDGLRFHESVARIEAVRDSTGETAFLALAFEGEGESWRETRSLRVLPDGRLRIESGESVAIRVRCEDPADVPAPTRWTIAASGEGDGLTLAGPDDRSRATLFCPARTDQLLVNVPAFRPVASEERMTIGSGGEATVLVADSGGDSARGGVSATGPIPAELDAILGSPIGISVNYGSQNAGPFPPLPPDLATAFLRGCRD